MTNTTALLRKIADQQEAERQEQWAERKAANTTGRVRKNPKWALDHLLATGQITALQYDAGKRYASALERSLPGSAGDLNKVDNSLADPHARIWDACVCAGTVRAARLWVLRSQHASRTRMDTLAKLFAYPHPTMPMMRTLESGCELSYAVAVSRITGLLDLLDAYFESADASLGQRRAS